MKRNEILKLAGVGALVVAAGVVVFRQARGRLGPAEKAFFYDVSAQKLFTAARTAVPPLRGVDGSEMDAFRAVVVSTNGRPEDRRTWRVAYLEKCSPELKEKMEAAQRSGEALAMGRLESQAHRWVRQLDEPDWHPLNSAEAERILTSWAQSGSEGSAPVVCVP